MLLIVILLLEHLRFLIMPLFVSQPEVYYKVDRLTDLTAQQSISTSQWDSNKTTLNKFKMK